jgi:hypothetical protein
MKTPRRALFQGPIGVLLLASVATGCVSYATSRVQAPLQTTERAVLAVAAPAPTSIPVVAPEASVAGTATWYRWHAGEAAAGPLLRQALGLHWRGQTVTVCASSCIRVKLTDWCLCSHGRRLVDLDSGSFAKLAPLSAGVIAVTVKTGASAPVKPKAAPTAPPTDIEGAP